GRGPARCAGARDGAARGRRGGRQCDRGGVGRGRGRRRRASGPPARRRPPGGERVTANRLVTIYSRALAIGGLVVLGAALILDPRWTGQPPELLGLPGAARLVRAGQVPLSEYSYLTQTGLVALAGSLVVGPPATALALAGGALR